MAGVTKFSRAYSLNYTDRDTRLSLVISKAQKLMNRNEKFMDVEAFGLLQCFSLCELSLAVFSNTPHGKEDKKLVETRDMESLQVAIPPFPTCDRPAQPSDHQHLISSQDRGALFWLLPLV